MAQQLKIFSAPGAEPLSATEAKAHLRVTGSDDDTLIGALITAAREKVEADCNRALITQTWDLYFDSFPDDGESIELPLSPVVSIGHIKSFNESGTAATFDTASYVLDDISTPGRIHLAQDASWPTDVREWNAGNVRFTVGYGATGASVPNSLKQAMLLLIGHWYENREQAITSGAQALSLPFGYAELIANYRVYYIG